MTSIHAILLKAKSEEEAVKRCRVENTCRQQKKSRGVRGKRKGRE